ncbi:hypothetical protein LIER_23127 [Lithospermum erythrorhizon]|uniref:Uncharacterized protein n=1 Tax=Lithospermum erythrorhizon TaxID=34254 RepID=A0AAV3QZD5_LITER
MANVEPNLPFFFNMHSTSHSGPLTSFSSLSEYYIFVEDKPDKVGEGAEEVLTATISSVEPRKVPLSTMIGKHVPLFKRAKVLDLTKEPLQPELPSDTNIGEVPIADAPLVSASSFKGKESDSAPKVMAGYSKNYLDLPHTLSGGLEVTDTSKLGKALDAFHATHPLLLEEIGKTYEEYNDPLEIQGVIAKHVIRAMNASYVMACRLDCLDVDLRVRFENERASHFRMQELEKENEDYYGEKFDLSLKLSRLKLSLSKETKQANEAEQKALLAQESANKAVQYYRGSETYQEDLGVEAAYCLCGFVKTFKEVNPSMVAHYQEFTSGYPSHWFTSLDINAPLSPMEGEEGGVNPKVQDPPQA